MTANALRTLANHSKTFKIDIEWKKEKINFNAFKRWVELWEQN